MVLTTQISLHRNFYRYKFVLLELSYLDMFGTRSRQTTISSIIAAAVRYKRTRRKCFLASLWRMKNAKIARLKQYGFCWEGLDSYFCLVDVSRAWLGGIKRTLFISCLMKWYLYPLLMRCVVSALRRLLKKSSVEQILLSRNAMLKGIDFLVWDWWQSDLRSYRWLSVGLT